MNPKEARKTYNEIIECDCLNCEVEILAKKLFCYIEELERQNELLRAVAEAARYMFDGTSQHEVDGSAYCVIHSDQLLNVYGFMRAAIDGGALEDKQ